MEVRFWGVRGSVAVCGPHVARVGGNTACVDVCSHGQRLILDAGTGLRALGESLSGPLEATFFFSHLHWDHVQGFPFFGPAWHPASKLRLYGAGGSQLKDVLAKQMSAPSFPVPLSAMKGTLEFAEARHADPVEVGPFRVVPFEVPHPQGCLGYRVEADGAAFVYMTDVELSVDALPGLSRFIEGADALVLDAQYTPDEYAGRIGPPKKGWGHSTMIDAALIAKAARVERLYLFHHDPAHNDDFVEGMQAEARGVFEPSELAREGRPLEVA